jgi:hypothetical protein
MTPEQSFYARGGLGVVCVVAGVVSLAIDRFRQGSSRTFNRYSTLALVVSRACIFVLVFLVLRIPPRGDIPAYYFPQALQALHGYIPYLDFQTSYAPLHPYMDAAALLIWKSPLAIILLAICAEALLLPIWLRMARELFPEQRVRAATLLYIASPISIQFVAIDGQNNIFIAFLLALAALACCRHRIFLSGVLVSLSVVLVKFIPLLFAPVFLFSVPRRLRWLIGFLSVLVLGYGGFALLHAPLLQPLLLESQTRTASNLPYLVESILGLAPNPRLEDSFALLAILLILTLVGRRLQGADNRVRLAVLAFAPLALTLALLLFSKKSWPPYLILALFPVCLLFQAQRRVGIRVILFSSFSLIAVLVQSFWATILGESSAVDLHQGLLQLSPAACIFLALELLLIAGYIWLLLESLRQITSTREQRPRESPLENAVA